MPDTNKKECLACEMQSRGCLVHTQLHVCDEGKRIQALAQPSPRPEWSEIVKKDIKEAVLATYPEDIFPPVPDDIRAKNNVLAQAMRDMAGAIASIAFTSLEIHKDTLIFEAKKEERERIWSWAIDNGITDKKSFVALRDFLNPTN